MNKDIDIIEPIVKMEPEYKNIITLRQGNSVSRVMSIIRIHKLFKAEPKEVIKEFVQDTIKDRERNSLIDTFEEMTLDYNVFFVTKNNEIDCPGYIYEFMYFNHTKEKNIISLSGNINNKYYFNRGAYKYYQTNDYNYPVQLGAYSFTDGAMVIDIRKSEDVQLDVPYFPLYLLHAINYNITDKDWKDKKFSFKYDGEIYKSVKDSINNRANSCVKIVILSRLMTCVSFLEMVVKGYDLYIRSKKKCHAFIVNNKLILTDGKAISNTTSDIVNLINIRELNRINLYIVNIYGEVSGIEYSGSEYVNKRIVILYYRDLSQCKMGRVDIFENGACINVSYNKIGCGVFLGTIEHQPPYNNIMSIILPKDPEHLEEVMTIILETQLKTIEDIRTYINNISLPRPIKTDLQDYKKIDSWFKKRLTAKDKQKDSMLKDIKKQQVILSNLKASLEKYVDSRDYSKCNPIPAVEFDTKVLKNSTNLIGLDYETEILNKIDDIKLEVPIKVYTPIVKLNKGNKKIPLIKKINLKTLYDNKRNILKLNYKEMKGK